MYATKKVLLEAVKAFEKAAIEDPLNAWSLASSSADALAKINITLDPNDRAEIRAIMDEAIARILSHNYQIPLMPSYGSGLQPVDEDTIIRKSTLPRTLPILIISECISPQLLVGLCEKYRDRRKNLAGPMAIASRSVEVEPNRDLSEPGLAAILPVAEPPEPAMTSQLTAGQHNRADCTAGVEIKQVLSTLDIKSVSAPVTEPEISITIDEQSPQLVSAEHKHPLPVIEVVADSCSEQTAVTLPDHPENGEVEYQKHSPVNDIILHPPLTIQAASILPPSRLSRSRFFLENAGVKKNEVSPEPADVPILVDIQDRRVKIEQVAIKFVASVASEPSGEPIICDRPPEDLALLREIKTAVFGVYQIPVIGDVSAALLSDQTWPSSPFKFLIHGDLPRLTLNKYDIEDFLPRDFLKTRAAKLLLGRALHGAEPTLASFHYEQFEEFAKQEPFRQTPNSAEALEPDSRPYLNAAHNLRNKRKPVHEYETQSELERAFNNGESLALSGPMGSGKSTICAMMLSKWSRRNPAGTKPKTFFLSASRARKSVFSPDSFAEIDKTVRTARREEEEGANVVLFIDEAQELTAHELAKLDDGFRQIIFCLDYWQSITAPSHPIYDFIQAAGGSSFELNIVWRAFNDVAFEILNFLIYGGRCLTLPTPESFGNPERPYKLLICPNDDEVRAITIFVRLQQIAAEGKTIGLVVASQRLRQFIQILLHGMQDAKPILRKLQVYDPLNLRSVEAEVFIACCYDIDSLEFTLEQSVVFLGLLLGRARDHLELIAPANPNDSHFAKLIWPVLKTSVFRWDLAAADGFENFETALNFHQIALSSFDEFLILKQGTYVCALVVETETKSYNDDVIRDEHSHYRMMRSRGWTIHIAPKGIGEDIRILPSNALSERPWFSTLLKLISGRSDSSRIYLE